MSHHYKKKRVRPRMKYTTFGRTGLRVSELALGGMTIGNAWGWGTEKETASTIFKKFSDEGGNFIDTSCNYQDGQSEKIIGELKEYLNKAA